jgi:hypothetical protein
MYQFLGGKQLGASGGQAYSVRQHGCEGGVFVLFHLPFHCHKLLYKWLAASLLYENSSCQKQKIIYTIIEE